MADTANNPPIPEIPTNNGLPAGVNPENNPLPGAPIINPVRQNRTQVTQKIPLSQLKK